MKKKYPDYVKQFQNDYQPDDGFLTTTPSETMPHQAKSVEEIIQRFATGMPLGVDDNQGLFLDDLVVRDVKSLDLTQRQELAIAAAQRANEIRRKLELADVERKKVAFQKAIETEYLKQQTEKNEKNEGQNQ